MEVAMCNECNSTIDVKQYTNIDNGIPFYLCDKCLEDKLNKGRKHFETEEIIKKNRFKSM